MLINTAKKPCRFLHPPFDGAEVATRAHNSPDSRHDVLAARGRTPDVLRHRGGRR
uniref:Uncharacterized protein n=1 Tax=Arundo donax TaxID=35708 RepID=A0A0A9AR52_ARUDO